MKAEGATLFHFYGGKGGVGKTTCAAARAVAAARTGSRVLAVSTDPAHSLGDALGTRLSARISRVSAAAAGRQRGTKSPLLHAIELDAPRAFARWLGDHRHALGDIVEHGTWLDREDVEALLGLPVPGIDELVSMLEIVRLAEEPAASRHRYDLIVVDTAPTGHTLRLLAAPETVKAVASVLDTLQHEHRVIREQLARVRRPEMADRLITLLADQSDRMRTLLRDPARTTMHWVMLPEELSLAETTDALSALDAAGIPAAELIVNRVTPDGPACPICDPRRTEERRVLTRAKRTVGKNRLVRIVPAVTSEPRGVDALARLISPLAKSSVGAFRRSGAASHKTSGEPSSFESAGVPLDRLRDAHLLFFGGKGGVGKTTAAAAAALQLAGAMTDRNVLLLSTDPAPSLSDVFEVPIGNEARRVPGAPSNLFVRELDAPADFRARRADLEAALDEIAIAVGVSTVAAARGPNVGELMELAPPGIDEMFGLVSLLDQRTRCETASHSSRPGKTEKAEPDLIVIDTAPTGHTLRLLEMPAAAREWVQALMRVLLKYRDLVRPGPLAAELLELSKSIRALQELMHHSRRTRFIVVTRAAELPRLETERLLDRLRRLRLNVPIVLVNARTLAPGRCPRCRAIAAAEQRELPRIRRACRRRFHDCAIIQAPLVAPPPRGVTALDRWAHEWIASHGR